MSMYRPVQDPQQYSGYIRRCEQALEAVDKRHSPQRWVGLTQALGDALTRAPAGSDRPDNLEEAIAAFKAALEACEKDKYPLQWAGVQNSLGEAYRQRIRGDRAENLERAIVAYKAAIRVATQTEDQVLQAVAQSDLGITYRKRIRGDRPENLEKAIDVFDAALEFRTRAKSPVKWAMTRNNLGNAYAERIYGDPAENQEQAIAAYKDALEVFTRHDYPVDFAMTQTNLGTILHDRIRGDKEKNLEEAIAAHRAALSLLTHTIFPMRWATIQNNLGSAWGDRIRGDREKNLERSIAAYEAALKVWKRSSFPMDWARTQSNLGTALSSRIKGERARNLQEAIAAYQGALEVYTKDSHPLEWARTQSNLGAALTRRFKALRETGDLDAAIEAYKKALEVFTAEVFPTETLAAALPLARSLLQRHQFGQARQIYEDVEPVVNSLYFESLHETRRKHHLRRVWAVAAHYAYSLVKTGEPQCAVEALEASRAKALTEALRGEETLDAIVDAEQREVLDLARRRVQSTENAYRQVDRELRPVVDHQLAEARRAYYSLLHKLASDFFDKPSFESVQEAVTDTSLVYLLASRAGGLALIVSPSDQIREVATVWLDDLTDEALRGRLENYFAAYSLWHATPHDTKSRQVWLAALNTIIHWLHDAVASPLTDALEEHHSRVILVPMGLLAFLPLHAAAADVDIAFTYSPNAHTLTVARERVKRSQTDSLLAVDAPGASLLFSEAEVQAALKYFSEERYTHLAGENATVEAVQEALETHTVWHFSTHGRAGWQEPLDGGLLLVSGERLTLRNLLSLQTEARLAVLSACETGIPGTKLPDEIVGLPSGLLQAGAAGVISSLWAVNDFSTALLIARFYQYWREEEQNPPEALHSAQKWLRSATSAEFVDYFKQRLPEFGGEGLSKELADQGYRHFSLRDPNERAFAHPFYWAGFYYTGL